MTAQIDTTLSDVFKTTPFGDPRTAVGDAFYGVDHRQITSPAPANHDQHGLTFFTRPQLNLTDSNVLNVRKLVSLMTGESVSVQRMVRNVLDPRLTDPCPVLDPKSAFIPVLSNLLLSLNGWPDPTIESYTSKPGVAGEEISFVDGYIDDKATYSLQAKFRNVVGDPISLMIDSWIQYEDCVFSGKMLPYPDFIANNEIDYMSRVYRLVLDKTRRYVQKIAACGACYPTASTTGQSFNYESDAPRNASLDELQINFRAIGWIYNDYMLVSNFNNVVGVFNPDMRTRNLERSMVRIPHEQLMYFKNRGYPRIDPNTMEMQWWISPGEYNSRIAALTRHGAAIGYIPAALQQD